MPPNHPILCRPLLLLPSILPSIKVFSNELAFHIRWSKYWSFSISLSNKYSEWFPLGLTGLISLLSKGLSRVFSSTTIWKHQFFGSYLEHLLRLLESVPPKSLKPLVKSIFLFAAPWIFFFFLSDNSTSVTFWTTAALISKMNAFYISMSSIRGLWLHIPTNTCYFSFKKSIAILVAKSGFSL